MLSYPPNNVFRHLYRKLAHTRPSKLLHDPAPLCKFGLFAVTIHVYIRHHFLSQLQLQTCVLADCNINVSTIPDFFLLLTLGFYLFSLGNLVCEPIHLSRVPTSGAPEHAIRGKTLLGRDTVTYCDRSKGEVFSCYVRRIHKCCVPHPLHIRVENVSC